MKVVYVAAHGGFSREAVPLGGGAAVYEHLVPEWERTRPFALETVTPASLGRNAPSGHDLVRFSERDYATFCRWFEEAATAEILRHDPAETTVLANDVSEGPAFERLAAAGYRVFTIYHVDVVAYVAAIYLRGLVRPETTVRWHKRLRWALPDIARLVWDKQEASVRGSRGLIVPSEGMREILLRCYPWCAREKVHVLPWGCWEEAQDDLQDDVQDAAPAALRHEFGVPEDAHVLVTLSRISAEKGQDLLLEALLDWERQPSYPRRPLWVFICGEAAYMQGQRFQRRLETLAARLTKTRVVFPGYVTGERKRAFFALADLYIMPSRHESYGLTLMEALAAGVPAVCLPTDGTRGVMRDEFGAVVNARELCPVIGRLLADDALRARMSAAALEYARTDRFETRAAQLAAVVQG